MMLKNLNQNSTQELKVNHLSFNLVSDHLNLNYVNFDSCDGLIINSRKKERIHEILYTLRTSDDPNMYLKPVFLGSKPMMSKFKNEVDGYMADNMEQFIAKKSDSILEKINEVHRNIAELTDQSEKLILKTLQFAYTRERNLTPYADRFSPLGYQIPFLRSIISDQDLIDFFNRLIKLENKSLLKSTIHDKINLCNSCLSSYLNFHETCSKCSSLDLSYENLIHHFRCAYIGPETDFQKDELLICPKCDKQLKHIGIDYDKPSEIAKCNTCNHSSQETKMKAKCIDCGTHNELSQLNPLEIRVFDITSMGMNWILENDLGFDEKEEELKDLKIVPAAIFDLLKEQEKERIKNSEKTTSFWGEVKIKEDILVHLNLEFREKLKTEILSIIRHYLRGHDILCAHHTGHIAFLLPDISQAQGYIYYETILDNLNKILSDNIKGEDLVTGSFNKL